MMPEPPLGAAVIGCGYIGERHAAIWRQLPYTELVSVYDVDRSRAEEVAEQYGGQVCGALEEAIGAAGVDMVSICTDDQSHLEPSRAAAAAGKQILLEKPLATSLEEADAIIAAASEAGVTLMVAHVVRFDPRYSMAKQEIDAGAVGDIVHLYGRRNNVVASGRRIGSRTSVAFFLGVHDIDIMRWFSGSDIVKVHAEGARKVLADVGADDTIFALFRFANGAVGCLETCWAMPSGVPSKIDARMDVVGSCGQVSVEVHGDGLLVAGEESATRPEIVYGPVVAGQQAGALRAELEHFAQCVLTGGEPLVSPQDARAAVEVAAAIHDSLRTGAPVVLEES